MQDSEQLRREQEIERYKSHGAQTLPSDKLKTVASGFSGTLEQKVESAFSFLDTLQDKPFDSNLFRKRTAAQIAEDGYVTGCTDSALVFISVARATGIPTKYVETFNEEWLQNPDGNISGHIYAQIYDQESKEWLLVDPQGKELLKELPKDAIVMQEGLDSWDIGITDIDTLVQKLEVYLSVWNKHAANEERVSRDLQPEIERLVKFKRLREETHLAMRQPLEERIARNPHPTEQEMVIGAFIEELEPQVRDAILVMNDKGYTTDSSGFFGDGDVQDIDGFFIIDADTKDKLTKLGVEVDERPNGLTFIKFSPKEPDLESIKAKWDLTVEILPATGKPAFPSSTYGSELFREQYANPDVVERIMLERRLANGYPSQNSPERKTVEARIEELKKLEVSSEANKR